MKAKQRKGSVSELLTLPLLEKHKKQKVEVGEICENLMFGERSKSSSLKPPQSGSPRIFIENYGGASLKRIPVTARRNSLIAWNALYIYGAIVPSISWIRIGIPTPQHAPEANTYHAFMHVYTINSITHNSSPELLGSSKAPLTPHFCPLGRRLAIRYRLSCDMLTQAWSSVVRFFAG